MKYFLIFNFVCKVLSFPIIGDGRIIFPDEYKNRMDDFAEEFKTNQMSLLNDPNILISDNMTIELLIDQQGFENFEDGDHFQGDMVMLEEQLNTINDSSDLSSRTGRIGERYRWPMNDDGNVLVPFEISKQFGWIDKSRIKLAMYSIEKYSCILFQKRSNQSDYINIISEDGCYSYVGKVNGRQKVSLRIRGCLTRGIIIHELMHALGFDHMHNHADRDEFIDINWNNIKPGSDRYFQKVNSNLFDNFGTPYDYYSVMHYASNFYSKNNKPTMVPKISSYKKVIGNRVALSLGDAKRLNAMYKCTSLNKKLPLTIISAIF